MRRSAEASPGRRVALQAGQVLFVPAHPQDDQTEVVFELRVVDKLGSVIVGFTTQAQLVAALGDFQPWVCIDATWLATYARKMGLPVYIDPHFSTDVPRWTANDLAAFIGGIA